MGKIADIISTPEFAQKSPLEKAQSRRDFFALTLQENPQIAAQFNASDESGQQKMADEFKSKLEADFPAAFKADGYHVSIDNKGGRVWKGESFDKIDTQNRVTRTRDPVKTPIYDIGTEQALSAVADPSRRDAVRALPKDVRQALAPFVFERYGPEFAVQNEDVFGKPEDYLPREESGVKKFANFAIPAATRMAPVLAASVVSKGNPKAVAAAGAAGEAGAQVAENILGVRRGISPNEIGLSSLFSIIPSVAVAKIANPALNMAAQAGIRGLEGAAQGGGYEAARQLMNGEQIDGGKIGASSLFGAGLGAIIGSVSPAIAARFAGKPREQIIKELPEIIAAASEADKPALTALQKQIDASLDIRAAGPDPVVTGDRASAIRSNLDLGTEPIPRAEATLGTQADLNAQLANEAATAKSQRQLDVEAALNAADAANKSPQGAAGLKTNLQAEATASQLENRTGRAAITPDSSVPVLEAGQARDGRLVEGATDPLGNRYMPAPEVDVGQMGKVRPASDFSAPTADPVMTARGDAIRALREGSSGVPHPTEAPALNPEPPVGVAPSSDSAAGQATGEVAAVSDGGQATTGASDIGSKANDTLRGHQASAGFVSPQLMTSIASGATGFIAGTTQGDTVEDRLRNGLVLGVVGLGGGYAFGKRFLATRVSSPAPVQGLKGISDVEKILTPLKNESVVDKVRELPSKFMSAFVTKYHAIGALEAVVDRANGIAAPALNLTRKFEQVAGATGKAAGDVHAFADSILPAIKGNEAEFDQLVTVKRIGQRLREVQTLQQKQAAIAAIPKDQWTPADAEVMAQEATRKRVADWTLPDVDNALVQLEQKLGTQRFNELDQLAAGTFQAHLDQTLKMQVAAGRISQASYDAIKASNDFYAPFRVLQAVENIETHGGAGVDTKQQIAKAITGIDDQDFRLASPTKAAAEQIFAGRILAEKNMKMLELAALADKDKTGDFIRKIQPSDTPRKGFETVNYFEDGVPGRLEVSPAVADAVKGMNTAQTSLVMKVLGKAATPFRAGATWGNASFQAVNLMFADQPRLAFMSKYGLNANDILDPDAGPFRYAADFVHSLYSSVGANMAGKQTDLYREFMASGAAGATIQDVLTPSVFNKPSILDDTFRPIGKTIETVAHFAKAIEETTKLMGFKRGVRLEGIEELMKTDPKAAQAKLEEVVTEVRNFTGSPDFARHGNAVAWLNIFFPFFNARIQGTVADLGRMAGADGAKTAAASWMRVGAAVGVPAASLWFLNHRDDNKADYEQIPEIERQNYFMLPQYGEDGAPRYFTNSDGKHVREYYRIPKREMVRLFSNLIESSLKFADSKDPDSIYQYGVSFLENVAPVNVDGKTFSQRLESIVASTNPLIKASYELASGKNSYTHRDTIPMRLQGTSPELQYTDSTPELFKAAAEAVPDFAPEAMRSPLVLQQLTQTLSAGLVTQFNSGKPLEGRSPLSTNFVAKRFFRSQTLNRDPQIESVETALRAQNDDRVKLDHEAQAALKALWQAPQERRGAMFDELATTRPAVVERMADIANKEAKGLEYDESLIGRLGVENGARARYLWQQIVSLPQEKRTAFFEDMVSKGLLNDAVADQIGGIMKAQTHGTRQNDIDQVLHMSATDGTRARYLLHKIQSLPQDQKAGFFDAMVEAGLLNDAVADQMSELALAGTVK